MVRLTFKHFFCYLCLVLIFHTNKGLTANLTHTNTTEFDLLLAGGGLSTCSSLAIKNCKKDRFSEHDLQGLKFQFDQKRYQNLQQSRFYKTLTHDNKVHINSLYKYISAKSRAHLITKSEIRSIVKGSDLWQVYQGLSDPLYYALFDYFEVQQTTDSGLRKTERVLLEQTQNRHSVDIYQAFYQRANTISETKNKSKPLLLSITASSRDPFESADFYSGVLASFPAEVNWLPLDMNLQYAMEQQKCDELEQIRNQHQLYNRAAIYPKRVALQKELCEQPERLWQLLSQADGIFFNGGDQSRTIAALTDLKGQASHALTIIKQQVNKKQLVIAGTSAGTAVQAGGKFNAQNVVMLSNGDPSLALKRGAFASEAPSARCSESGTCAETQLQPGDLTYRRSGGTGLFSLGLLDTHFSERDREVRLNVFAHATNTRFAFGVDEATALTVNHLPNGQVAMGVIGESGVYFTDTEGFESSIARDSDDNFVSGLAYFVHQGDTVLYDGDGISVAFSERSEALKSFSRASDAMKRYGQWRASVAKYCGSAKEIRWHQFDNLFVLKASTETKFAKNDRRQCSYSALPYVISR